MTTRARVLCFAGAVAASAAGLSVLGAGHDVGRVGSLPPAVLFALFVLAELVPVQIELRREAHTYTLVSVVAVVGLFTLDPVTFVAVRVLASLTVRLLQRQEPAKAATNLAAHWLEAAVSIAVLGALGPVDVGAPRGWVVVIGLVVATDLLQGAVFTIAIALHTGRFGADDLMPGLLPSCAAIADAAIGLAALLLVAREDGSVVLLLAVPAVLVVAYRSQANLRAQHRDLSLLYEFTRSMSVAMRTGAISIPLLSRAAELMHADRAWLFLEDHDTGALSVLAYDARDGSTERWLAQPESADLQIHESASTAEDGVLVPGRGLGDAPSTGAATQLVVAPLQGASGRIGTLAVGDRSGAVRSFQPADVRLFSTLARQASTALENGALIEQIRHESALNEHQALHDSLTGLGNRVLFDRLVTESTHAGERCAVLLLDLDRFKEVNDTLGHHRGDQLLGMVAERLRGLVRTQDLIARLGGDEFAVLLRDVPDDLATVERVADHVMSGMGVPFDLDGLDVAVGVSIGVAVHPDDGSTSAELLQRADVAMYLAKEAHTGIERYDVARDRYSHERLAMVSELRDALDRDGLRVHFQPQIDLRTGDVRGVEALARWRRADGTTVAPHVFVEAAERAGLISRLTRVVLDRALRDLDGVMDAADLGRDFVVSINLSPRNLVEEDLAADLQSVARIHGFRPAQICLELTESSAMSDPRRTLETLGRLRAAGFQVSIDDFGTGYSSMSYLQRFPAAEVKIDRSFVQRMSTDRGDAAIVSAVVELSRSLALRTVAEGVEDALAMERLRALGCDRAQGFFIARPMPVDDLVAWLPTWRRQASRVVSPADDPTVLPLERRPAVRP